MDWPTPRTIKQLRGFLGLIGYYRCFEKGYAQLAAPLTDLLKKNHFVWNDDAQIAFKALKRHMTYTPVLVLPNFTLQFVVETDASNTGVSAVLSQEGHPLAFFSKKLTPKLSLASTYVRELYAITQAVMKWRHYLLGRKFLIKTDHRSLHELVHQVIQTPEQHFYLAKLMGFQYEIVFRSGASNIVADALSRREEDDTVPSEGLFFAIFLAQHTIMEALRLANTQDEQCIKLHEAHSKGPLPDGYSIRDGLLLFQDRLFVPNDADLRLSILEYYHSSPIGGHGDVTKTLQALGEIFYWAEMKIEDQSFVKECLVYQQTKYSTSRKHGHCHGHETRHEHTDMLDS